MVKKLIYSQTSWNETAGTVKEELRKHFPNLEKLVSIGEPQLAYLEHSKPHYQLGYVMPLKDNKTQRDETVIYYPMKKVFIHFPRKVDFTPVAEESPIIWTKRGNMQVVNLKDDEYAISFSKSEITVR